MILFTNIDTFVFILFIVLFRERGLHNVLYYYLLLYYYIILSRLALAVRQFAGANLNLNWRKIKQRNVLELARLAK